MNVLAKLTDYLLNDEVENAFELIIEIESDYIRNSEYWNLRGILCLKVEEYQTAIGCFEKSLAIDPTNGDACYNCAFAFENLGNNNHALKYYSMAYHYSNDEEIKKQLYNSHGNHIIFKNAIKNLKMIDPSPNRVNIDASSFEIPKVTITITTYNQKFYLKEAIESCLKQDYSNLEILVVDDCSTDGTDILMEIYRDDNKVRYVRNEVNLGPGNNSYNIFYNLIDSKYALSLNHDDYLIRDSYITEAVDLLERHPNLSLVWANCKIIYEDSGKEDSTSINIETIINGRDYFLNYETIQRPHITGILTTVFNVEKLRSSGYGLEKTKSKDTFKYLKLMLMGDVGFINEHVSVYRVHKNSLSFNMPKEFDQPTIEEFEALRTFVLEKKIANINELEIWINRRVYTYILWRFRTLWNNGERKYALELLMGISKKYPFAYEDILNSI